MIVLCRHGETGANAGGRFLSAEDAPLNDAGRAACARARDELAGIAFAVCRCSPMLRCTQSRAILAPQVPFELCEDLREVNFGRWDGKTLEWLRANDPEGLALRQRDPAHFQPPGGESFAAAAQRLRPLASRLAADGRTTLVVSHRGTLGVLERLLRGLPVDDPGVVPLEPGDYRIISRIDVPVHNDPSGSSNTSLQ
jgi:broad specificity phosphatase PhoE